MITVCININGKCVMARSATNIKDVKEGCLYKTDCGKEIIHNPEDGAVKLAHKLLDCIDEAKEKAKIAKEIFKEIDNIEGDTSLQFTEGLRKVRKKFMNEGKGK